MDRKDHSSEEGKKIQNEKSDTPIKEAFKEAEKDMDTDESMQTDPEEKLDLDEGELARKEGHP